MTSGIYAYYDTLDDMIVYVGQSVNIRKRHNEHFSRRLYDVQKVNSILQNNPERYSLIILKECEVDLLDYWEITFIALFNPKFNFTNGGGGIKGHKHSDYTKDKLKKARRGRKITETQKHKVSKTMTGTGFFHVYKEKNLQCKRGFTWRYQYIEDGKLKRLGSVSIVKLKQKVLAKGLPWKIIDESLANQIIQNELGVQS